MHSLTALTNDPAMSPTLQFRWTVSGSQQINQTVPLVACMYAENIDGQNQSEERHEGTKEKKDVSPETPIIQDPGQELAEMPLKSCASVCACVCACTLWNPYVLVH